ncbi:MAG: 50S ribosomal protein L25 [Chitinophagales bacterium]|nr:50S ribosomal protein L25 [Chitinophagales bacterium]MDW8392648.1 50S ribosomal protein L25 [Chitinophagales bacterium]
MKSIVIEGTLRQQKGSRQVSRLRSQGLVPCNLYGAGRNILFAAPAAAFRELVYTPEFYTATIRINGEEYSAILQEVQFHPVTDQLLHLDFRMLDPNKKIVLELPIRIEGTAAGTREGGKLQQRLKKLKVRLFPKDLVEHITVDVTSLNLGKSIRVGDLKMEGIEFLNAPHLPVVTVRVPRAAKEETPAAAASSAEAAPAAEKAPAKS